MSFECQFVGNSKTGPIACPVCNDNVLSDVFVALDDRPSINEFDIVYFDFWQPGHRAGCDNNCIGLKFVDRLTGYG